MIEATGQQAEQDMKQMYPHQDALTAVLSEAESQTAVARAIGISPTALSHYLRGVYHEKGGSVDNINQKISAFIAQRRERADNWREKTLDLQVTKEIMQIIRVAHNARENGIIWGPAGIGKTEACRLYESREHNAILITARNSSKSVKGIIALLYKHLKRGDLKHSAAYGFDYVVERLKGTNKIIIIDQAHRLSNDAIQELQAVHDETGVPFIFVGTPLIFDRLKNPMTNTILAEMASRITIFKEFGLVPYLDDLKTICSFYGASNTEIIKLMKQKAHFGGLRIVRGILRKARYMSDGGKPSLDDVQMSIAISEYRSE